LGGIKGRFLDESGEIIGDAMVSVKEGAEYKLIKASGEEITCQYLIGTNGSSSLIRRSVFGEEPPFRGVLQQFLVDGNVDPNTVTFFLNERYSGKYRWGVPCADLTKISFPASTDHVDGYIEKHFRPICSGVLSRIVRGNTILVGDAVGQTHPLTMRGIRIAMEVGRKAAEAILEHNLSIYQRWWGGSGFSSLRFVDAHRRAVGLSNEAFSRLSSQFA